MINHWDKKYIKKFGKHIRELRLSKDITQKTLGASLGKNQIGNIERGEINPTLGTIKKLAEALGVEPKDLLDF